MNLGFRSRFEGRIIKSCMRSRRSGIRRGYLLRGWVLEVRIGMILGCVLGTSE